MKFTKRTICLAMLNGADNFIDSGETVPFIADRDYSEGDFVKFGDTVLVATENVLEGQSSIGSNYGQYNNAVSETSSFYNKSATPLAPYSVNIDEQRLENTSIPGCQNSCLIVINTNDIATNILPFQLPARITYD